MISLSHVSKSYAKGKKKAVEDVTLEVRPGEIFGFIGPNGAGKTTTIKMITGILAPDSGTVTVAGVDIAKDPVEAKMRIGYVPDTHEVYDRLTGREYLHFIADMYGLDAQQRKQQSDELLDMLSLQHAIDQQIRSYSHGMKQKLLLTGALMHRPPLWILDEPLTGLDPKASHLLKELMRKHCDAGNTVFFSTHVLEVAEKLCDRIGIIRGGRLIAVGTIEELTDKNRAESLEDIFLELTDSEGETA
nr:ABC transporter ATP-binding protein [bacterium]